jgi:ribosomal protein L16/L10AE
MFEHSQADRDRTEAERIERARSERDRILAGGSNVHFGVVELSQAERDAIENERIARARAQRENLLRGSSQPDVVRFIYVLANVGSDLGCSSN